jgi:hypothetical protein
MNFPMPTVFLSSVARGLEEYREAAYRAIEGMDGYHCVRMEDFGARASTPYNVCLDRVRECDFFVAILGHNYGSNAPETGKSYSESEYDAAAKAGKQLLVFLAPEEFALPANLIEGDELREKQAKFRSRAKMNTVAFLDQAGPGSLGMRVVQAIHNCRTELLTAGTITEHPVVTKLLFPFVTNQAGFDTGIVISNVSDDPFGTERQEGTCTIHFYGRTVGGAPAISQISGVIHPGEQLLFTLSNGGSYLMLATPGFQGYLIVECRFKAVGVAFVSDVGAQKIGSFCNAQVI